MSQHHFKTEVSRLLDLIIHSLYSHKEIFLRELVSNASDAIDKLRYLSVSDDTYKTISFDPRITVTVDADAKTLTVTDNGIGMTDTELEENLGTIARSGTKDFFQNLSGDQSRDSQLIGQFGVGFYSAFIVADKVTVISRIAGQTHDKAVRWESVGDGSFTVAEVTKDSRGTDVILHLKEDETEFLDDYRLRSVIGKYSDHISIPVELWKAAEAAEGEDKPATEGAWA
jgi:molecular chaperone HtpG